MMAKIMTWDEFREVCREDAANWAQGGYTADELTEAEIIHEYPDDYFCDSTNDEYDDLSSAFTPAEFTAQTLEYLADMTEEAE